MVSSGTLQFAVNSGWSIAGTDYSKINVGGTLDLSGSTLTFVNSLNLTAPLNNQLLTLINHIDVSTDTTITTGGTSPSNGASVNIAGHLFKLFYNAGDGNDVNLIEASTPNVVYVSATAWTGFVPGKGIADADFGTSGSQAAVYGVTAFSSVASALATLSATGQIIVNVGTYAEPSDLVSARTFTTTNGVVVLNSLASPSGSFVQVLAHRH